MFNYRMSANEALDWGLVSKVISSKNFDSSVKQWIHDRKSGLVAGASMDSLTVTKSLIVNDERRALLHKVNKVEMENLRNRFISEEAIKVAEMFLERSRKSK